MNRLFLTLLFVVVIAAGCSKSTDEKITVDSALVGKWTFTDSYYSIGGPLIYEPANPANQYVHFMDSGEVITTTSFLKKYSRYEVVDSSRVKFYISQTNNQSMLMGYYIDDSASTLSLYPVEYLCIEGCGYLFKRSTTR